VTIARIVSGNARARDRPEVIAKVEAYNRSRTGVRLPEQHKVRSALLLYSRSCYSLVQQPDSGLAQSTSRLQSVVHMTVVQLPLYAS
jgi:hypothetical protein